MIELFKKMKLSDKEACPCGSGSLYKDCCKNKIRKTTVDTKKPLEVQVMERMRKSMKRCCLHPDQATCKKMIKKAHALQNNKIMSLLAGESRHVYLLDAKKKPIFIPMDNGEVVPIVPMSRVSANEATTETCFCELHDTKAFEVIEAGAPDFDPSNKAMKFVYAYKAFIFEYYKQSTSWEIFQKCFSENPQAFRDPKSVALYRMLALKMQEFEPVKALFDNEIMAGTYKGIYTVAVKLPQVIKFAAYAYVAPTYDLEGKKIKHTRKGTMHRIALTIFPEKTYSWILVSCLDTESNIYQIFFEQLGSASVDKIKFYFNMMLPLLSENVVLSPDLWEKWSEDTQMAYTVLANSNGPEAVRMEMAIGMRLRNAARSKKENIYSGNSKINLFQ